MLTSYDCNDALERLSRVGRAHGQAGYQVNTYSYYGDSQDMDAVKDRFTSGDEGGVAGHGPPERQAVNHDSAGQHFIATSEMRSDPAVRRRSIAKSGRGDLRGFWL
jgi:hypothetical protein